MAYEGSLKIDTIQQCCFLMLLYAVISPDLYLLSFFFSSFSLSLAVLKKAEMGKKSDVQTHSPSRKVILKPAVKQPRPAHQVSGRRKPAGDRSVHFFANVAGKHDFG